MNRDRIEKIARRLLYEGYILYPYRPATKNRQRWTFGGLYPPAFSVAQNGTDPSGMQTECLLRGTTETSVAITLRFLHLMLRTAFEKAGAQWNAVRSLVVDGEVYQTWQEATERNVPLGTFKLSRLLEQPVEIPLSFMASNDAEFLKDKDGVVRGQFNREQLALRALVWISASAIDDYSQACQDNGGPLTSRQGPSASASTPALRTDDTYRLTVRVENQTAVDECENPSR